MNPSTESPAWRTDTKHEEMDEQVYNGEQSPGSRPADQPSYTTKYRRRHESLSPEQCFDALGDLVSGRIDRNPANAGKKCKSTQPMRTEDFIEEMKKVQEEAEEFARTACRGRRLSAHKQQKAAAHSTPGSTAALGTRPALKNRRVESASLLEGGGGKCSSQAVRSLSDPPATARHDLHHSLHRAGNRSEGELRITIRAPTISKYSITRARGSQSDNSFLLRRGDRGTLLHKKRTTSEPGPRGNHSGRSGSVTVRSGNLVLPRKQSLSAFKKPLSTNGNVKARLGQPLSRRASEVEGANLFDKERVDPRDHSPLPRSSPRLLQRRKDASRLRRSVESLQKYESKKRKSSIEPGQLGRNISQRLRSSTRHATGVAAGRAPGGHERASQPKSTETTDKNTVADVAKKARLVKIPVDTEKATEVRKYSQWPDDSGALVTARGCLLPAMYKFSGIPGLDWICPVRSCRRCFQTQARLGSHFVAAHHSCLLNDNHDGTFTISGKYKTEEVGARCPALVKSKNPLTKDTPPMLQPQPPATWVMAAQKKRFAASLKEAKSTAALDSSQVITVDEMMLQKDFFSLSSDEENSSASELSELSPTPSFEKIHHNSKPQGSLSSGSKPPGNAIPDEESTSSSPAHENATHENASNAPHDATKENWRLIRRFLTGRQFHLPKRGHFAALLSTPRSRELTLRPGLRFAADQPKKVRILMAHMTGDESPVPCNSCDQGHGPFKKCVTISKAAAGETTNGVVCCTNCATKRGRSQKCNVEVLFSQPDAAQRRKPRWGRRAPEARQQQSSLGENSGTSRVTKVDGRFTLTVHTLPIDGSIHFDREPVSVRLCSVAAGKVMVDVEGNPPFLIGTHGMFKLMPEMTAQVSNASEAEAVLHLSKLKS